MVLVSCTPKPYPHQNGFGIIVALHLGWRELGTALYPIKMPSTETISTATISTAKWFWNKSGCNNESMFFVVYFNVYQVFVQMSE